jgi:hypothetical protein
MPLPESRCVPCHDCTRGGNGLDPNPCSCGWQIIEPSTLGCYLGERIPPGAPRKQHPKLSASQKRYAEWCRVSDCFPGWKFGDWLKNKGYDIRKEAGYA